MAAGHPSTQWPVERTARLAQGHRDGVLSDINFGEVFPFVAKPLAQDGLERYIGPTLGGQVAGLSRNNPLVFDLNPIAFVAGRPYMDLSAYINLPAIQHQLGVLEAVDRIKGRAIGDLAEAGRLNPVPIPFGATITLRIAYLRMGIRSLWWLLFKRTPVELRQSYARTTDRLRALVRAPLDRTPPAVLLADLDREFDDETDPAKDGLRHLGLAMTLHTILVRLAGRYAPVAPLDDLSKGIPHNPTTTISLDLWALAQEARPLAGVFEKTPPDRLPETLRATEDGRRWWTRFEEFLALHGHRGEVELDMTAPRWREDPAFLLQSVANYLRHPAGTPTPPEMMAEGMRRREAAAEAITKTMPWPIRNIFRWLYERYVLWMPFREAMKYTWLLGLEEARRVYREIGRRLAAAGHLAAADDVFWLRLPEVRAWAHAGKVTWMARCGVSEEFEVVCLFRSSKADGSTHPVGSLVYPGPTPMLRLVRTSKCRCGPVLRVGVGPITPIC